MSDHDTYGDVFMAIAPEFIKLAHLREHAVTDNLDGVSADDFAKAAQYTQDGFVQLHARGVLAYYSPSLSFEFAVLADELSAVSDAKDDVDDDESDFVDIADLKLAMYEIAATFKLAFRDAVVRLDTKLRLATL
ncbi:hypothetical protein H9P43_005596 [Blastocladiella emersonii ATCC 22665]|nr:hypothetical protein H9P43_005596 [Blastocladiella emersonii ATCC 22665]